MGALWRNLLTKLKHIKVKHKAVSPHLIRDSRGGQRERKHEDIHAYRGILIITVFFNNAVENED